jgi:Malonate decarboxylase gamma subunit (MdcE)
MTLDEVLDGLFPSGHDVQADAAGIIIGTGKRKQGGAIAVIGVANGAALGTAGVLPLAGGPARRGQRRQHPDFGGGRYTRPTYG